MKTTIRLFTPLAAAMLAFFMPAKAAYIVIDLGSKVTALLPSYIYSNGSPSLNNSSNVAFTVMDSASTTKAILYTYATNSIYLIPPLPGGAKNTAADINDSNYVVGSSRLNYSADIRGYVYVPGLGSMNIDHYLSPTVPSVPWSEALAINNSNLIIGRQINYTPSPVYTYWLRKDGISSLWTNLDGGLLTGTPVDLDNNGEVLVNPGNVIYNSNTNDATGVVGVMGTGKALNGGRIASISAGSIYLKNGPTSTYIGPVPAGSFATIGNMNSSADFAINVTISLGGTTIRSAYVCISSRLQNLTTYAAIPGWTFFTADDINDYGDIVGTAKRPDGQITTYLLYRL